MNSFKRIFSLGACLLLACGVMTALSVGSYVPEVLEVGPAIANGTVAFTLNAQYGGGTLAVSLPVSSGDSAAVVAAKIQAAVSAIGGSTWSAQASTRTVTFSHFDGSTWSPVAYISGLSNTAGAADLLAAEGANNGAYIVFSVNGTASGRSMASGPGQTNSSLTFRINGIDAPFQMTLAPGQSSASIVSALATYLNALSSQMIGGYVTLTPNSLSISLLTYHAAVLVQTNDSGLQGLMVLTQSNGGGDGGGGTDKGHNPPL